MLASFPGCQGLTSAEAVMSSIDVNPGYCERVYNYISTIN